MELAANVWPVVDEDTGLVVRFFIRAYAFDASDETIGAVLRGLAPADFHLARAFPIPKRFAVSSPYGTIHGAVTIGDFHHNLDSIVSPVLESLEDTALPVLGIDASGNQARGVGSRPDFPEQPYLVTTAILESASGDLKPHIGR